ncbi:MAG TPA: phosphopantetheine-binding protein [Candidatus Nanopelagicales bacterium]|nr:phosphopantetheine-binding protein [Candidatus Nanopelagicales bacterium]
MSHPDRLTPDAVLADLGTAAGIDVAEIDLDEDFADLGVDSISLMRLLDRWRADGAAVGFADLAACPTVRDAVALLTAR